MDVHSTDSTSKLRLVPCQLPGGQEPRRGSCSKPPGEKLVPTTHELDGVWKSTAFSVPIHFTKNNDKGRQELYTMHVDTNHRY